LHPRGTHLGPFTALGVMLSLASAHAATPPPCEALLSSSIALHGRVSTLIDNAPPADDLPQPVLDPSQQVIVLTLNTPLCGISTSSTIHRVVTQPQVLVIEVVSGDPVLSANLQSRVGAVTTITGTLAENVWWHYRAALLLRATKIE
jgi:hypothetical protein